MTPGASSSCCCSVSAAGPAGSAATVRVLPGGADAAELSAPGPGPRGPPLPPPQTAWGLGSASACSPRCGFGPRSQCPCFPRRPPRAALGSAPARVVHWRGLWCSASVPACTLGCTPACADHLRPQVLQSHPCLHGPGRVSRSHLLLPVQSTSVSWVLGASLCCPRRLRGGGVSQPFFVVQVGPPEPWKVCPLPLFKRGAPFPHRAGPLCLPY